MPTAAPMPPTHGPNRTAKTAGMKAAGQKATPPRVNPKLVEYPTTKYSAAHIAVTAKSNAFILGTLLFAPVFLVYKAVGTLTL